MFLTFQRAVAKAKPFLRDFEFDTGNPSEDVDVKELMNRLLDAPSLQKCSNDGVFDEKSLFRNPETVTEHFMAFC